MLTDGGLVIGWPSAVLLQYDHVPLVALDLVQGLLRLSVLLPGPASLQVTVLVSSVLHSHWSRSNNALLSLVEKAIKNHLKAPKVDS